MKTIHIVMRRDYLKTEPIIAFDNKEDADAFMHVLTRACDRNFGIFNAPFSSGVRDGKSIEESIECIHDVCELI